MEYVFITAFSLFLDVLFEIRSANPNWHQSIKPSVPLTLLFLKAVLYDYEKVVYIFTLMIKICSSVTNVGKGLLRQQYHKEIRANVEISPRKSKQKQSLGCNPQKSQENKCARDSFLKKLQAASATLLKRRLCHRCFPVNFATISIIPFFKEQFRWLLLKYNWKNLDERIMHMFNLLVVT